MVILNQNLTYIRQRTLKDIWERLYEFPLIESRRPVSVANLIGSGAWSALFPDQEMDVRKTSGLYKHILTHQELHARFYLLAPGNRDSFYLPGHLPVPVNRLADYPVPALIARSMKELMWMNGTD